MGPMGELGALFNPGMRHELEERQAKAARREEEGNARDGDLRIDLESGVAVIGIPGPDDQDIAGSADDGSATRTQAAGPSFDTISESHTQDASTSVSQTPGAAAAEDVVDAQDDAAPAPALRPRGKRGLSATRR